MSGSGLSPAQERARAAEAMAFERAHRPQTARELHAVRQREMADRTQERVHVASDWLLERVPALRTPGGLACNFAIHAAIEIKAAQPRIRSAELLRLAVAYRDRRLKAIGADDMIVPIPEPAVPA